MERLTTRWNDGSYDTFDPIDVVDNEYTRANYEKVLRKLGEYEDLEEQGLLLRLPCKVGDAVFLVDSSLKVVHSFEVSEIRINKYEVTLEIKYIGDETQFRHWAVRTDISKIGEWVFLTQAEAEAALEAMEKG